MSFSVDVVCAVRLARTALESPALLISVVHLIMGNDSVISAELTST